LERRPDIRFLLFGREDEIAPILRLHPKLAERSELRHCEVAIKMTDKPSQALRAGRRVSSMWRAIESVKHDEADCAISAGNTGALMAMAKICLHMMPQIERPALAAVWPTLRGESIVLDVGATIGADARHLVDLAVMGAAMARILFDIQRPTVGLINVGVEEIKGIEEVKAAGRILRETNLPHMDYHGFVEGDDLGRGTVDVFVTEGFTGNILLKTAEGTAKQIGQYMREALGHSWMTKLGYWFARAAFRRLREKMDPGRGNGGVFLGLDGVVIKSHGGADAASYAGAIEVGYDMVRQDLLAKIREMIGQTSEAPAPAASN
jgi:glycerol-3-phosphate acyltransferase PlsX